MEEMKQPLEQEVQSVPTETPVLTETPAPTEIPALSEKSQNALKFWTPTNIFALVAGVLVLALLAVGQLSLVHWITGAMPDTFDPSMLNPGSSDTEPAEGYLDFDNDGSDSENDQSSEITTRVDTNEIKKISSYSYTDASLAEEHRAGIVAKVGEHELHNGLFQIFYWSQVYSFINSYGEYVSYLGMDTNLSLSEQYYGEDVTWEQYFIEMAMDMYLQYCALYDEATARGVGPGEEAQAALDTLYDDIETYATNYGYASADEYLSETFGPGVTKDDYVEYYTLYATANAYANEMQMAIEVSEIEVNTYYDANAAAYQQQGIEKINQNVVNVRHILIQPERDIDSNEDLEPDASSEEAWAAAEKAVNETYERWLLDPTEDNFAMVATDTTYDTASAQNGGLYEGVYPGQMVAEFENWCFDSARQPGDHDIIRTDYGYHIMYFVGEGDYMHWYSQAEYDCKMANFDVMLNDIFDTFTIEPNFANVHIYDIFAVNAAENAAAAEAAANAAADAEVTEE